MSIHEKQRIKCPVCGEEQEIAVWQSITAEDTDLKEDLLKGRVNMFRCGACGQTALVPSPVLYTDSEKRLMITFSQCGDDAEKQKILKCIKKASAESGELDGLEDYNLRFVPSYNDFLEKLLIFDSGLHDKAVEVIKLLVLLQEPEKMKNRVCIFGKNADGVIEFMVQDKSENRVYTSKVPEETYETVYRRLAESGVKYKSFDWELVDRDYAASLLNGANNPL